MLKTARTVLLSSTALGLLLVGPAQAADSTADAVKALQQQVSKLQKQLDELKTKEANKAVADSVQPKASSVDGVQKEVLPGVKVTLGGFAEVDAIYRSKNQTGDATNLNTGIPFENSLNSRQSEFRGTARATRLTLLAEGKADKDMNLAAYIESDFAGSGSTSNSVSTNSYVPRLRQAFAQVDRNDWGLHFVGGQAYSLATLGKNGQMPRTEALPSIIDPAFMSGFVYTRNPQLRVVKDFADKKVNLGLSLESPQVNTGGITIPGGATPVATISNKGGASLNDDITYSTDVAPDIIVKASYDAGFGHFEAFGLTRFFHDIVNATGHNNTEAAFGGGLGAYVPVIPKKLEAQATIMAGEGIGRYGASALPDFAVATNGDIKPLKEYMMLVGLTAHPTPTWDVYGFAGGEKVFRDSSASSSYGFIANNAGCYTLGGTCTANTESVFTLTAGTWKQVYKGDYGNIKLGAQYMFARRDAFEDANGANPHANENVVLTSFRYSPF